MLATVQVVDGTVDDLYSKYVYGALMRDLSQKGWVSFDILHNDESEVRMCGHVSVI